MHKHRTKKNLCLALGTSIAIGSVSGGLIACKAASRRDIPNTRVTKVMTEAIQCGQLEQLTRNALSGTVIAHLLYNPAGTEIIGFEFEISTNKLQTVSTVETQFIFLTNAATGLGVDIAAIAGPVAPTCTHTGTQLVCRGQQIFTTPQPAFPITALNTILIVADLGASNGFFLPVSIQGISPAASAAALAAAATTQTQAITQYVNNCPAVIDTLGMTLKFAASFIQAKLGVETVSKQNACMATLLNNCITNVFLNNTVKNNNGCLDSSIVFTGIPNECNYNIIATSEAREECNYTGRPSLWTPAPEHAAFELKQQMALKKMKESK